MSNDKKGNPGHGLYTENQVANLAKAYHETLTLIESLDRSDYEGPNGVGAERQAVSILLDEALPRLERLVSPSLEKALNLNLSELRAKVSRSL